MSIAYNKHASICAKFYDLTVNSKYASDFVIKNSKVKKSQNALFVGGMFEIAKHLIDFGINLTVIDYSDEMIRVGKEKLPNCKVIQGDLSNLNFENEFDFIFVVGRVFTHMISDEDLNKACKGCHKGLKKSGYLFCDNYESSKIRKTSYFNGTILAESDSIKIERKSTTSLISENPYLVTWSAQYTGKIGDKYFDFSDSMEHRAWSRNEIAEIMKQNNFTVLEQGDNFDETSFFTLARSS